MENKLERPSRIKRILKNEIFGIFIILILMCIALTILRPTSFPTAAKFASIGRSISYTGVMAVGMTFVIITGGIDLTVGSVFGLAGVVIGICLQSNVSLAISILLGLLTGVLVGALNGLAITKIGLPPFIVTLSLMNITRGMAQGFTSGSPIKIPDSLKALAIGDFIGIPYTVCYMIVLAVIFSLILSKTVFGRQVYALGGNEDAARLSGLNTTKLKVFVYAISGFLAAFAGIMTTARLGVAQSANGDGYEMDVIASVVIGGTSMTGGKGTIIGSLIGAVIMGVLRNGLVMLDVNAYWQKVVIGSVIMGAVTMDMLRNKKSGK